jgi:hypothetical protein
VRSAPVLRTFCGGLVAELTELSRTSARRSGIPWEQNREPAAPASFGITMALRKARPSEKPGLAFHLAAASYQHTAS